MGEFYKTKESVEQYVKSAEGFDGKVLIDKFTKHLTSKATVLEIGSGPGKDLEILSKNPDYKVIGSDNSEEFISYLQNKYSIGNFLKLEARSWYAWNWFKIWWNIFQQSATSLNGWATYFIC